MGDDQVQSNETLGLGQNSILSEKDKQAIIERDSPKLTAALGDLEAATKELKTRLLPLLTRIKEGEVNTSKGLSLLEFKAQLLLSYTTNLSFYLLLKSSGSKIHNHPVILQLVKIRTYLEKLKPIEHKLKYQIDKLIKTAVTGKISEGDDARRFRPNVDDMVPIDDNNGEEGEQGGVYRPPQLAPVNFEEDESSAARQAKQQDRERKRAQKSEMVQLLRETFSDAPLEIKQNISHDAPADVKKAKQTERERLRFEEENFMRMTLTKDERKQQKKMRRVVNPDLQALQNFGEIASLTRKNDEAEREGAIRQKALKATLSEIRESATAKPDRRNKSLRDLQKEKLLEIKKRKAEELHGTPDKRVKPNQEQKDGETKNNERGQGRKDKGKKSKVKKGKRKQRK